MFFYSVLSLAFEHVGGVRLENLWSATGSWMVRLVIGYLVSPYVYLAQDLGSLQAIHVNFFFSSSLRAGTPEWVSVDYEYGIKVALGLIHCFSIRVNFAFSPV